MLLFIPVKDEKNSVNYLVSSFLVNGSDGDIIMEAFSAFLK